MQSIFGNEVLAFDVNFFNPKPPKTYEKEDWENAKEEELSTGYNVGMTNAQYEEFKKKYGMTKENRKPASDNVESSVSGDIAYIRYQWKSDDGTVYRASISEGGIRTGNQSDVYVSKFVKVTPSTTKKTEYSPAYILQPTIASWYLAIRNIALVALLSILVYIGIRITLTSVAGDKAKYKQMLVDWVVALALVFLMHYIMSFAVTINGLIVDALKSIAVNSYGSESEIVGDGERKVGDVETDAIETAKADYNNNPEKDIGEIDASGVQLFVIDDSKNVKKAYTTLVDDGKIGAVDRGKNSPFYNRFYFGNGEDKDPTVIFWPANDFMEQARMLGQNIGDDETQTKVARAGYNIIYTVLVIYTVIFCFTYLKRVVYMAFLTLMAPLVAITYPIDKISDGKAQAFDMWIKEYIFNLLMQPMHLILYTILVGMAMKFAATNIFYTVVAIGFLVPAEKILRRFFRFERAQTPGMFEGAAGAALMMSGLNKLMHRSSNKSRLGSGSGKTSEEGDSKVSTYKDGKDPLDEIGKDKEESKDIRFNDDKKENSEGKDPTQKGEEGNSRKLNIPGQANPSGSPKTTTNTERPKKQENTDGKKKIRMPRARRAIRRGLSNYGKGMKKRYKAKGGLARRALRTTAGIASAATMAAAGGIAGIASGDFSKAAQYMAAGAVGGYKLGKSGVDKTADKLNEQFKEPLHQAKVGFYGEDEYARREHEKFKKREFEQNVENIQKIQEKYDLSWEEAKEKSMQIAKYTDKNGINSFNDAFAVDQLIKDGYSESEAIAIGNWTNNYLDGQGADKMKRSDRTQRQWDLRNKLIDRGFDASTATKEAKRMMDGTNKFAKYAK